MYSKHWCSCRDRINDENSHQSLASLVRNTCWILYFESDTKIQKIPSKKLSNKDWTTGWIPVFSSREHHFEICRVGCDCWLCRLKFNMSGVSKHTIALDRNILQVYKLISHNIFILMFCNSLEQCKISVGCSYCTRVDRNHLFFQFLPRISGVN